MRKGSVILPTQRTCWSNRCRLCKKQCIAFRRQADLRCVHFVAVRLVAELWPRRRKPAACGRCLHVVNDSATDLIEMRWFRAQTQPSAFVSSDNICFSLHCGYYVTSCLCFMSVLCAFVFSSSFCIVICSFFCLRWAVRADAYLSLFFVVPCYQIKKWHETKLLCHKLGLTAQFTPELNDFTDC